MTRSSQDPDRARRVLGVPTGASPETAKRAFRERVKALHPDRASPTPETLSELSAVIDAMRAIEAEAGFEAELWISAAEGRSGVTRLVSKGLRCALVRIPAGVSDGAVLQAVGDEAARITIRICPDEAALAIETHASDAISSFFREFAAPSPAARFARWARGRRPAA